MFDQLVFMAMDTLTGVAADRAGRLLGRMAAVVGGVGRMPDIAPVLALPPVVLWFAGGAAFAVLARAARRPDFQGKEGSPS
jgi:hypothetical protein